MKPSAKTAKKKAHRVSATNFPAAVNDLVEADWIFVKADRYKCQSVEKPVLFRYELAREAVRTLENAELSWDRDRVSERWAAEIGMMRGIFHPHFPKAPYLAIDGVERRDVWRKAFLDTDGHVPFADDPYWFGFSYRWVNGYKDTQLVDDLIQNGEIPETPEPRGTGGNYPYLRDEDHRNEVYDPHRGVANIEIDLNFENSFLVERFEQMLHSIRDRGKIQPKFRFPAGTTLDEGLRWLAIARLTSAWGKLEAATTFLGREGIYFDDIKVGYKSWQRVEDWINNPPVVPRGKKSVRNRRLPRTEAPNIT